MTDREAQPAEARGTALVKLAAKFNQKKKHSHVMLSELGQIAANRSTSFSSTPAVRALALRITIREFDGGS